MSLEEQTEVTHYQHVSDIQTRPSMTFWDTDYCAGQIAANEAATCIGYAMGARSPLSCDTWDL